MSLVHPTLKIVCFFIGIIFSVSSFVWNILILYVLSQTNPNDDELLRARYLDIALGILGFVSSLALTFGTCVESRVWMAVWFLGSFSVIIAYWIEYVTLQFGMSLRPESLDQFHLCLVLLTSFYGVFTVILVIYFRNLDPPNPRFVSIIIGWQSWPLTWPFCLASRSLAEKQTSTVTQTKAKSASICMARLQELGRREELYHPV